jgi:hypothetical protein
MALGSISPYRSLPATSGEGLVSGGALRRAIHIKRRGEELGRTQWRFIGGGEMKKTTERRGSNKTKGQIRDTDYRGEDYENGRLGYL